ncbi:unnamed protein product [Polarella glacialis]|uniref:Uncharacterized protein n=1 Tax=Polarella glacialis TaxID=89957 RepID=A0A813GR51_POLGL|nr:unnamed protein product [Polarella glacialis]
MRDLDLEKDAGGFLLVETSLQARKKGGDVLPNFFAAGDCCSIRDHPRPKAGVFAVMAGMPLSKNIRAALEGRPMVEYLPQKEYLGMIGLGSRSAVASKADVALQADWLWDLKAVPQKRSPKLCCHALHWEVTAEANESFGQWTKCKDVAKIAGSEALQLLAKVLTGAIQRLQVEQPVHRNPEVLLCPGLRLDCLRGRQLGIGIPGGYVLPAAGGLDSLKPIQAGHWQNSAASGLNAQGRHSSSRSASRSRQASRQLPAHLQSPAKKAAELPRPSFGTPTLSEAGVSQAEPGRSPGGADAQDACAEPGTASSSGPSQSEQPDMTAAAASLWKAVTVLSELCSDHKLEIPQDLLKEAKDLLKPKVAPPVPAQLHTQANKLQRAQKRKQGLQDRMARHQLEWTKYMAELQEHHVARVKQYAEMRNRLALHLKEAVTQEKAAKEAIAFLSATDAEHFHADQHEEAMEQDHEKAQEDPYSTLLPETSLGAVLEAALAEAGDPDGATMSAVAQAKRAQTFAAFRSSSTRRRTTEPGAMPEDVPVFREGEEEEEELIGEEVSSGQEDSCAADCGERLGTDVPCRPPRWHRGVPRLGAPRCSAEPCQAWMLGTGAAELGRVGLGLPMPLFASQGSLEWFEGYLSNFDCFAKRFGTWIARFGNPAPDVAIQLPASRPGPGFPDVAVQLPAGPLRHSVLFGSSPWSRVRRKGREKEPLSGGSKVQLCLEELIGEEVSSGQEDSCAADCGESAEPCQAWMLGTGTAELGRVGLGLPMPLFPTAGPLRRTMLFGSSPWSRARRKGREEEPFSGGSKVQLCLEELIGEEVSSRQEDAACPAVGTLVTADFGEVVESGRTLRKLKLMSGTHWPKVFARSWNDFEYGKVQELSGLRPFAEIALKLVQPFDASSVHRYHVHPDGSAGSDQEGNRQCAWAVVVIAEMYVKGQHVFAFVGAFGGPVREVEHFEPSQGREDVQNLPEGFLGAQAGTNIAAELQGIVWAALWELSRGEQWRTVIHPDCVPAIQIASKLVESRVHPVLTSISQMVTVENGVLLLSAPVTKPDVQQLFPKQREAQVSERGAKEVVIDTKVLSGNVLTFGERFGKETSCRMIPGRTADIAQQLQKAGCSLAGFQEARTLPGVAVLNDFYVLSSGATARRSHGCELWASLTVPYGTAGGQPMFFKPTDFTVVVAEHDAMLVVVQIAGRSWLCVIGHAPHALSGHRRIDSWWRKLGAQVNRFGRGMPTLAFLDANAVVGCIQTASIGEQGQETETFAGSCFRAFLESHRLIAPATFGQWHEGSSATWVHPGGPCEGRRAQKAQVKTYERSLIQDPARVQQFKEGLAKLPVIPWAVDVDTHLRQAMQHVQNLTAICFPVQKTVKQQPWMMPGTWALIVQKREQISIRRTAVSSRQHYRLVIAFGAWSNKVGTKVSNLDCAAVASKLRQEVVTIEFATFRMQKLHVLVIKSARKDKQVYIDAVAQEAAAAAGAHDHKQLHQKLFCFRRNTAGKRCRPFQRPLPRVLLEDGEPAATQKIAADRWQRHFAEMEAGVIQDFSAFATGALDRTSYELPEDIDIEVQCANFLHPLYLKCSLFAVEPLKWKGGCLLSLFKGKGDTAECGNSRAILISGVLGKALHRAARKRLIGLLQPYALETQLGGIRGGGTDMVAQVVRAFIHSVKVRKVCGAAIFADILSAFYRVIRSIVMPLPCNDAGISWLLDKLRVPPEAIHVLRERMSQPPILQDRGASPHLQKLVGSCHQDTYFQVKGTEAIASTAAGTRPGDPYGDVLFSFLIAECFKDVRVKLESAGLQYEAPWDGQRLPVVTGAVDRCAVPADPSYFDDFVRLVEARTPEALIAKTQAILGVLDDAMLARGLQLNFKAGKTGVMFRFAGPGAVEARKQVFIQQKNKLTFSSALRGQQVAEVVQCYRHVGSEAQSNGSNRRDLFCRRGMAHSALLPMQKQVYANRAFSVESRLSLLGSFVHSRLYYNVHVWCHVTASDRAGLHRATMSGYRVVARAHDQGGEDYRTSDVSILEAIGATRPAVLLSARRLGYLPRMLNQAPGCLFAFLQHTAGEETSWHAQLQNDIDWMRQALFQNEIPDVLSEPHEFFGFVEAKPKHWQGLIRSAVKRDRAFHNEQARCSRTAKHILELGQQRSLFQSEVQPVEQVSEERVEAVGAEGGGGRCTAARRTGDIQSHVEWQQQGEGAAPPNETWKAARLHEGGHVGSVGRAPEGAFTSLRFCKMDTSFQCASDGVSDRTATEDACDPYVFGRIAALHALSDCFAMVAQAQTALALCTISLGSDEVMSEDLFQIIAGANRELVAAGCTLAGGHTTEGPEPGFGLCVTGVADDLDMLMKKGGLKPGDALILTKPLGTGCLFAGETQQRARGQLVSAALRSMLRSNEPAAQIARLQGSRTCTDVTGFGLAGHLLEMCKASEGIAVSLWLDQVPVLDGAEALVTEGIMSSLQPANFRSRRGIANEARSAITKVR